jgi:hypothetical protein
MKQQKTGGALVLCIALLMSTCGENPVIDDGNNTSEREERIPAGNTSEQKDGGEYIAVEGKDDNTLVTPPAQEPGQEIQGVESFDPDIFDSEREEQVPAGNTAEQKDGGEYITAEGKDGNTVPTAPPVQEPGQEIQGMEPFDPDIFNRERAAWEAGHPTHYTFYQIHKGPEIYLSTLSEVKNDIAYHPVLPDENRPDPVLRCNTISELYEKIDELWTEQRYPRVSFLIKYGAFGHCPTDIQIKNINGSGDDYFVHLEVEVKLMVGGVPWALRQSYN